MPAVKVITLCAVPKMIDLPPMEILDRDKNDGTTKIEKFKAYIRGPGCPVPIVIETDQVFNRYDTEYPKAEEREQISITEYIAKARRADLVMRRDLLLEIIVPKLKVEDANILANTPDGEKILVDTEWFSPRISVDSEEEEEEEESEKGNLEDGTGE